MRVEVKEVLRGAAGEAAAVELKFVCLTRSRKCCGHVKGVGSFVEEHEVVSVVFTDMSDADAGLMGGE